MPSDYVMLAELRVMLDNHGIPSLARFKASDPEFIPYVTVFDHVNQEWAEFSVRPLYDGYTVVYSCVTRDEIPSGDSREAVAKAVEAMPGIVESFTRCQITLDASEQNGDVTCPVCRTVEQNGEAS